MESIKNSTFSKFEGSEISGLSTIKGGDINTGGGAGQANNGDCFTFTSDCLHDNGTETYCGVKVQHQN